MVGIFIIGTDTGVGKTVVAGGLLRVISDMRPVKYWKPVQTGTVDSDDTSDLRTVTKLPEDCFLDPGCRFRLPLSPHLAADREGGNIDVDSLMESILPCRNTDICLVVEGAGGLMVPYGHGKTQLDLVRRIGLPVLLVVEDRLGAINHSLLTLKELERENVKVMGVVLTKSSGDFGNADSIRSYGKAEVLAEFPKVSGFDEQVNDVFLNSSIRQAIERWFG